MRELKELTKGLDAAALIMQLGPFVLVQRPYEPQPRALHRGVTAPLGRRPTATVDFDDLWVLTLPPVREADAFVIGRGAECDVVIDEKTVSSQHARIEWSKGEATLTDLDSSNGTQVNGKPAKGGVTQAVQDNDAIDFGAVRLIFMKVDTFMRRMGRR